MKLALLFLILSRGIFAAVFVTVGGTQYDAKPLVGSASVTVTGKLVDGGFGANPDISWSGAIVILDRHGVPDGFVDKLRAVQDAGGIGAIIANDVSGIYEGALLLADKKTPTTSPVPAFTISKEDGANLRNKLGSTVTAGAAIPPPPAVYLPPIDGQTAGSVLYNDGTRAFWAKQILLGGSSTGSVKAGSGVTFLASSDGNPAPSFQWQKNGADIAGATTSSLAFAAITVADAGSYTCISTNSAGSATGGPYILAVTQ